MAKRTALPATSAGHIELMGRVKKTGDGTLDIPAGTINLGGNGHGYILQEQLGWDPAANSDGSVGTLDVGDDIYIYAVRPASSDTAVADLVASRNTTYPDGHDADDSRKLAGFHYGKSRALTDRYDAATDADQGIIPNSVWDLLHRPRCDPSGMVEIIEGSVWMDIYLSSSDGAPWPDTAGESVISAQPLNCNDIARWDFFRYARNAGKRLPRLDEMLYAAYGVPQGATGAGGRVDTGEHSDYGHESISCLGLDQPAGNLWQWCSDGSGSSSSYNNADQGEDSQHNHGQARLRHAVFGGHWSYTSEAGSRCTTRVSPWSSNGYFGFRCACDAR